MSDHSDPFKVAHRATQIKAVFSMASARVIADIALTSRRRGSMRPAPGLARLERPAKSCYAGPFGRAVARLALFMMRNARKPSRSNRQQANAPQWLIGTDLRAIHFVASGSYPDCMSGGSDA